MENVTAYDIALIGGGLTVVGALIGALSAYWLATALARVKEYRTACARLRAAFAPALAMIYLARHHGNHDRPDDHGFVKNELLRHAAAVEEFRVFVPDSKSSAYQEAWESYRKDANQDSYAGYEQAMGSVLALLLLPSMSNHLNQDDAIAAAYATRVSGC